MEAEPTRVLCLCEGGNVRSVQLAYLMKAAGHDAVAAGVLWNSSGTIALLCSWADVITVAEERLAESVPEDDRHKVTLDFVVGPDVWGVAVIDALQDLYVPIIKATGRYGPDVRVPY